METETNGQTLKLLRNVGLQLIRDKLKYLEMSRIIPSFWFAQLVPFYRDRDVESSISKLGGNSKTSSKNYLIIIL